MRVAQASGLPNPASRRISQRAVALDLIKYSHPAGFGRDARNNRPEPGAALIQRPPRWQCSLPLEFRCCFATETVQFADGEHHCTLQLIIQITQVKWRAAESSQLIAQALGREWLLLGDGQRHG